MSTKFMNFLAMAWFVSMLICLILEGSYLGTNQNSVINDLIPITVLNIGGVVPIPAFNINFFRGVIRLLLWDYSFYEGGYAVVRYFWMAILSPGAAWGIGTFFSSVYANFLRVF